MWKLKSKSLKNMTHKSLKCCEFNAADLRLISYNLIYDKLAITESCVVCVTVVSVYIQLLFSA